jgi:tight adherence protein B
VSGAVGTVGAVGLAALALVLTVGALLRGAAARRLAALEQAQTVEVLRALAAELRAGSPSAQALAGVAADLAGPAPVVDAARHRVVRQPSVVACLTAAAAAPDDATAAVALAAGPAPLRTLAACWATSAATGAPLARLLGGQAEVAARERTAAREVEAALAGPRTTALLLAGLPVLGLGLAAASGADPVAVLVGTGPGRLCLAGGVLLDATGLWWVERWARPPARDGPS